MADVNWKTLITDPAPWIPGGKEADDSNFPNAKEEDLDKIIEEETKEDFSAVQQLSQTMTFSRPPIEMYKEKDLQKVEEENECQTSQN